MNRLKDTLDVPCVSVVEPLFIKDADPPYCTRTWQADADPKLSDGQLVDVGGTACHVIGKTHSTKGGTGFVTYQFAASTTKAEGA